MDLETLTERKGNLEQIIANTKDDKNLAENKRLLEIDKRYKELEKLDQKIDQLSLIPDDNFEAITEAKAALSQVIEDHDVYYITQQDRWWFRAKDRSWKCVKSEALKMEIPVLLDGVSIWLEFKRIINELGRVRHDVTYSWNNGSGDVLNLMETAFCPLVPEAGDHHWFFDCLMLSLGGGSETNKEHIEKVLLSKYQHPENNLLPTLVIGGADGGVGKSLFVSKVASTMFGSESVADNVPMDKIIGQFNSLLIGKAFVFINESVNKKVEENRLHAILGSDKLTVERKGIDAFEVNNTALYMISGNDILGSVKLAGNNIDRRYSIINADTQIEAWLVKHDKHMFPTIDVAAQWIGETGQHILSDKEEVGKWLAALTDKYGDVTYMKALHSDDYQNLKKIQQKFYINVFDTVFYDPNFRYIKQSTLLALYQHWNKEYGNGYPVARNTFYKLARDYIKDKKLTVVEAKVKWGGESSANCFVLSSHNQSQLDDNDEEFVKEDIYGKIIWAYRIE
ncbi:MAG: hypothetical protein HQ483_07455 [Rhodospirillales bacterium]|nr:hypothetical protein [Rhodospirillales bacterium]